MTSIPPESLASLRDERVDLDAEQEDLPDAPAGERADLDQLRICEDELEADLSERQSSIQFNEDMHEDDTSGRLDVIADDATADTDGSVTDQLLTHDTVTCWTCGMDDDVGQIDATLERLHNVRAETLSDVNDIREELDELIADRKALEEQDQRKHIERRLAQIDDECAEREATIEELQDERETLLDATEILETEICHSSSALNGNQSAGKRGERGVILEFTERVLELEECVSVFYKKSTDAQYTKFKTSLEEWLDRQFHLLIKN